ncbi:helix-turn-helix domain-containing protein [Streptomyces sp. NPDC088925]|uniref:helix-turn-helix domain-containing protein n=1 Tax=Streptomyces sp. NPDC088925 TaxID=3365914 RepID=UPI0037FCEC91
MSIALMIAAAYLPPEDVTATEKLALMKLADSADDDSRLSVPTQRRLVAWVGVSEKRVSTVITSLVKKGLVERVTLAREGRAAVYRVFPNGMPITPQREELDERLHELRARPKNPALARTPKTARRKPKPPARTARSAARRAPAKRPEETLPPEEEASKAGFPSGNPAENQDGLVRVSLAIPPGLREGNQQGSPPETPSFPSVPSSPLPPTEGAAPPDAPEARVENRGCPRHRQQPGTNCRACGTTARQRERARVEEGKFRDREAGEEWIKDFRAGGEQRRAQAAERAEEVAAAKAAARAAIRKAKTTVNRTTHHQK